MTSDPRPYWPLVSRSLTTRGGVGGRWWGEGGRVEENGPEHLVVALQMDPFMQRRERSRPSTEEEGLL